MSESQPEQLQQDYLGSMLVTALKAYVREMEFPIPIFSLESGGKWE